MAGRRGTFKQAQETVLESIRAHGLGPGSELPPVKALASVAGVSFVTMWKALDVLKKQGIVSGAAGHPYRVAAARGNGDREESSYAGVSSALPLQSTAWRRTADQIGRDIISGAFGPGTVLPSVKEMQRRYGVVYLTLKKALDALIADRTIERHGQGFAVESFAAPRRNSRVIWITHSSDSFSMYLGQHDEEVFRTLEKECMHARISLDVFLAGTEFPESLRQQPKSWRFFLRERRTERVHYIDNLRGLQGLPVLGIVLVSPGPYGEFEREILPTLARTKKPVAVLAQSFDWQLPAEFAILPNVRMYSISASVEPGRAVGRYLLAHGHRRIAFISPYHDYVWSRQRLEGICSVYKREKGGFEVSAFTHVNTKQISADREVRSRLLPLLGEALRATRDGALSAWIVVTDQCASMAMEFLSIRGVNVPADISIASFDDTVDSLRLNLTSYNFNASAAATAMLGFMLNRAPYARRAGLKEYAVEGFITERQSVRRL